MLGFIRRALNHSTAELQLLIVSMSSPTIGNTNVSCSLFCLTITFCKRKNFLRYELFDTTRHLQ